MSRLSGYINRNMIIAGIFLMLAGNFMFALNDAMGKWLVASFSVGQVVFVRSVGAFIILGPMIVQRGAHELFHMDRIGLQVVRVIATALDTVLFYAAVIHLPLADVMSFYMAGPIYVAVLSHVFLKEKVGWRRWLAIILGFCGVLVMLNPSSAALSLESIYALIGSVTFAIAIVLSRVLRGTSDTALVAWQTIGVGLCSGLMAIGTWKHAPAIDYGAMLVLGLVSSVAHLMITRALKMAPASTLAPLQYTLLLWAVVFGILFFNDVPSPRILIGGGIVVLAGLFIFHRQNVKTAVPPENVPKGVN